MSILQWCRHFFLKDLRKELLVIQFSTGGSFYEDAVKAPIAKTQNWMQNKKDQILDAPLPNLGPIPLGPSPNMTVRDSIDAAKDNFSMIVGGKEGDVEGIKGSIKDQSISKVETNTAESIKKIINGRGYSVDEFAALLHPDKVLSNSEKLLVDSIRKELGLPSPETLMSKTIPQSDLYKYIYNQYDGVLPLLVNMELV